jgi:DmsE family decaheme c-type cytochrome
MSPHPGRLRLALAVWIVLAVVAACASQAHLELSDARVQLAQRCASCHASAVEDWKAGRFHAGVAGALGCLDCHGEHESGTDGTVLAPAGTRECVECHAAERAQFERAFRHPLGSSVTCLSCHDPHGGPTHGERERLRTTACVGCHVELRGPFVFHHEGDQAQGCLSCHEAHGGSNRRMLTHRDARTLCMSCHEDLDQSHTQEPGSNFRNCMNCHVAVHGSNWSRDLFR